MKKLFLAIAIIAFSTLSVQAQYLDRTTTLSIGVNAGIPTNSGYSFAYGADLQADFGVAATTKITVSAGYQGYSVKSDGSTGIVPLLAGVKFNLGEKA